MFQLRNSNNKFIPIALQIIYAYLCMIYATCYIVINNRLVIYYICCTATGVFKSV